VDMIGRPFGSGRYAVTEWEKRWLLRRVPEGVTDPVDILDKYLLPPPCDSVGSKAVRRLSTSSGKRYGMTQCTRQSTK
jgi:hypothetical protein